MTAKINLKVNDEINKENNKEVNFDCSDYVLNNLFIADERIFPSIVNDITGIDYTKLKDNIEIDYSDASYNKKDKTIERIAIDAKTKDDEYFFCIDASEYDKLPENVILTRVKDASVKAKKVIGIKILFDSKGDEPLKKISYKEEMKNLYEDFEVFVLNTKLCAHEYTSNILQEKENPRYIVWGAFFDSFDVQFRRLIFKDLLTEELKESLIDDIDLSDIVDQK